MVLPLGTQKIHKTLKKFAVSGYTSTKKKWVSGTGENDSGIQ